MTDDDYTFREGDDLTIDDNGDLVPASAEERAKQWARVVNQVFARLKEPVTIADLAEIVDAGAAPEDRQAIVNELARIAITTLVRVWGLWSVTGATVRMRNGVLHLDCTFDGEIRQISYTHRVTL